MKNKGLITIGIFFAFSILLMACNLSSNPSASSESGDPTGSSVEPESESTILDVYNLTWDFNGGVPTQGEYVSGSIEAGTAIVAPELIKTGYTFDGWDKPVPTYMPSKDLSFKAQWRINQYTITFDTDGGSEIGPITQDYGTNIVAPFNPTKSGYVFDGWDKDIPSTMPAENLTIKANWRIPGVQVTFICSPEEYGFLSSEEESIPLGTSYTANGNVLSFNNGVDITATPATPTAQYTYSFDSWSSTSGIITGSTTITANFVRTTNSYDVHFDSIGGSHINDELVAYNALVNKPSDPTKSGYTFGGWYKEDTFDNEWDFNNDRIVKETTIFASWTVEDYIITYNLNGGAISEANPTEYNIESDAITLNNPTKKGFIFLGWTGTDLVNPSLNVTIPSGSVGNRTYIANWEASTDTQYIVHHYQQNINNDDYTLESSDILHGTTGASVTPDTKNYVGFTAPSTVTKTIAADGSTVFDYYYMRNVYTLTWNADGGIISGGTSGSLRYGASIIAPTVNRIGYSFVGWDQEVPSTMPADNLTIKALWINESYVVSFNANDGEGVPEDVNATFDLAMPTITSGLSTRTGYKLTGYYDATSGGTKYYNADGTSAHIFDKTSNTTLYAQWANKDYIVEFNTNGGSPIPLNQEADYGEKINAPSPVPTKLGYTFGGWYKEDTFDNEWDFDNDVVVSNTILYAKWTANTYTVSFNANGGENKPEDVNATFDLAMPTITSGLSTRTGYRLTGYFDATSGGIKYYNADGSSAHVFDKTSNTPLYAQWTTEDYTIEYDLAGGTVSINNPTGYNIESSEITLNNPTKIGYIFLGWTGTDLVNPSLNVTIPSGSVGNRTYIANWEAKTYNIVYKDEGNVNYSGDNLSALPVVHTYNQNTNLTAGEKVGYTFVGWYQTSDCSGSIISNIPANYDEGDITLFAKWSANKDTQYVVHHYQQNINDDDYTLESSDILHGTTGASVTPDTKNYVGFTAPSTVTKTIAADGSTVFDYYYMRNVYTLTWDANGGVISGGTSGSVKYGTPILTPSISKAGYSFESWDKEVPLTMPDEDVTIKANWNIVNYNIDYDLHDGSLDEDNPSSYNVETDDFTLNNPTKEGYTFGGWRGTSVVYPSTSVTIKKGSTGDRSYEATWNAETYNIHYFDKGGEAFSGVHGSGYPTIHTYGENTNLDTPTKENYYFRGWYFDENCTGSPVTTLNGTSFRNDITLYAYWTRFGTDKVFTGQQVDKGSIVVDGIKDVAYDNCKPISVNEPIWDFPDMRANAYIAWDTDENHKADLYIFVEVEDATYNPYDPNISTNIDDFDSVKLFVDLLHNDTFMEDKSVLRPSWGGEYRGSDKMVEGFFRIAAGASYDDGNENRYGNDSSFDFSGWLSNAAKEEGCTTRGTTYRTDKGYNVEYRIDVSNFFTPWEYRPNLGQELGIALWINDKDRESGTLKRMAIEHLNEQSEHSPSYLSTIRLVEDKEINLVEGETLSKGTVKVNMTANGLASSGLVFASNDDATEYYYLYMNSEAGNQMKLLKHSAGVNQELGSCYVTAGYSYTSNLNLKVVFDSGDIKCFFDDKLLIAKKDLNPLSGNRYGTSTKNSGTVFTDMTASSVKEFSEVDTLIIGHSYMDLWANYKIDLARYDNIMNIGIGGTATTDWIGHLDEIKAYNPKQVIYDIGINDFPRGTSPETILANVKTLVDNILNDLPETKVCIVSTNKACDTEWCKYFTDYADEIDAYNGLLRNYVGSNIRLSYADVDNAFLKDDVPDPSCFVDGLHPTAEAYLVIRDAIYGAFDIYNDAFSSLATSNSKIGATDWSFDESNKTLRAGASNGITLSNEKYDDVRFIVNLDATNANNPYFSHTAEEGILLGGQIVDGKYIGYALTFDATNWIEVVYIDGTGDINSSTFVDGWSFSSASDFLNKDLYFSLKDGYLTLYYADGSSVGNTFLGNNKVALANYQAGGIGVISYDNSTTTYQFKALLAK